MLNKSTDLSYPIATIMSSGKKNFKNIGRFFHRSGDTVRRLLQTAEKNRFLSKKICQNIFAGKSILNVLIDDTLINKNHSHNMQGTDKFFDSKTDTKITAFKVLACAISDGKYTIPIASSYIYSPELMGRIKEKLESKEEAVRRFIKEAKSLFPNAILTILVDGLFSTVHLLTWCFESGTRIETRMHSNRTVFFRGQKTTLKAILNMKSMKPTGNRTGRTFSAIWHGFLLYFTIERRIDKHGEENLLFLASTYKAAARDHIRSYKKRWPIEMLFRTTKQELGLNDCQSIYLPIQENHITSVFLAYGLLQLELKNSRAKTIESALRRLKQKSVVSVESRFSYLVGNFHEA